MSQGDKLKLRKEQVSVKVNSLGIRTYVWDSTSIVLIINRLTGKNVVIYLENPATEYTIPSVSTINANDISSSAATCGGNVTIVGGYAVTARSVCWSPIQNPTTADNKTSNEGGPETSLVISQAYYLIRYIMSEHVQQTQSVQHMVMKLTLRLR